MSAKSSNTSYGYVAKSIHWVSLILIVALLASGFRAAETVDATAKAQILSAHAPLGIAILILTLLRLIWWWAIDTKPAIVETSPRWQERAARAVHILFYIIIFGMGASGIGMLVLSGAGPILFAGTEGTLPDFTLYAPRGPHGFGASAIVVLITVHAGAALYHHFVQRDATLRRMWFTKGNSNRN